MRRDEFVLTAQTPEDLAHERRDGELVRLLLLANERGRVERDIARQVAQLRERGASWAVVGSALGTSRQGAQQRYGGK